MARLIGCLLLLLAASARAELPAECEKPDKDLGPNCTELRVIAADKDSDGQLTLAETQEYIKSGDFVYLESAKVVRKVAPNTPEEALLEGPLLDFSVIECPTGLDCPTQWGVQVMVDYARERNSGWRRKSKLPVAIKASRKASDPLDPRGGADLKSRPMVVSYKKDDVKDEKGAVILGTLSGPPVCDNKQAPKQGDTIVKCGPVLALDVDTSSASRGANKSDVSLGFNTEVVFTPVTAKGVLHRLVITPSYLTDADFGRDVVLVSVNYSLTTPRFGGPGHFHCIGKEVCGPGDWGFSWAPSVVLQAGDVRDASGNATLAERQNLGSYVRVSPSLSMKLYGWDRRGVFGLDLVYSKDLDIHGGKGYGELSYTYDLSSNIAATAILRKGYKLQTLDYVDSLILGLGFSF